MGGDDVQWLITYPKKRKIFQKLKTIVFYKFRTKKAVLFWENTTLINTKLLYVKHNRLINYIIKNIYCKGKIVIFGILCYDIILPFLE